MIRTAVVLAGGKGVRLRPLTLTTPKPLLPVGNKPILDHMIGLLVSKGFEKVVIAVNYLGHKILSHLLEKYLDAGVEIVAPSISPEDTADAVRKLAAFVDEDFLVAMGDVLTNIDLRAFTDFHEKSGAFASVGLIEVPSVRDFGAVILDKEGRVLHFIEKPTPHEWYITTVAYSMNKQRYIQPYSNLANSGFYAFKVELLDVLSENPHLMDFGRHVFPWLLENGYKVMGWSAGNAYWIDVGRPASFLAANMDLLDGLPYPLTPYGSPRDGLWVGEDTVINEGVMINPPVALGDRVEVLENSVIGPYAVIGSDVKVGRSSRVSQSVIMNKCTLEDQTFVMNSILAKNILVGMGASVRDSVIGEGSVIGSGLEVIERVVMPGSVLVEEVKSV